MLTGDTIPAIVRRHVERSPDREVMTFRDLSSGCDTRLTYGALWTAACTVAEALGPDRRGARAMLVLPIGARLASAHLGVLLSGRIAVIHSHPSAKMAHDVYMRNLTHVIAQTAPDCVVTNAAFAEAVTMAGTAHGCRVILEEELPAAPCRPDDPYGAQSASDVAIVQHSSGSTGLQKGVALTHQAVLRQCDVYARHIRLNEDDRICSWLPLYHDMGLFTTWLMPLLAGVRVAAVDPFAWVQSPGTFLKLMTDFGGTLCWQPNFAYNLLATRVRDEELAGIDLSSMRGFTNCSEPARAASHRMFLERFAAVGVREQALWVCYAMAENAFAVTGAGPDGPVRVRVCEPSQLSRGVAAVTTGRGTPVVSVGRPVDCCEVKVVDGARAPVLDRMIGEVALRSHCMLTGYDRNEEATARAIDAEGWYYTGDLGFLDEGELYITGRQKDLLIVGGRNFYPQDIEAVCDACDGAIPGRAVAIGDDDPRTGTERIVLLVESHSADPALCEDLARRIRQKVFEELDCAVSEVHVVPHMWLLKTTSGKIARRPNLERYRQQHLTARKTPTVSRIRRDLEVAAWAAAVALAILLWLAFEPNPSWGVYAGF